MKHRGHNRHRAAHAPKLVKLTITTKPPREKTHVFHPVFSGVTVCGRDSDLRPNGAIRKGVKTIWLGRAFDCRACYRILRQLVSLYEGAKP